MDSRSSFRCPDQVAARVGGRCARGEGNRAKRLYWYSDYRGVAEAQPWKRRRAVQGREPRASTWITAGFQFTVVRECGQQYRIKVCRVDYSHLAIVLVYRSQTLFFCKISSYQNLFPIFFA